MQINITHPTPYTHTPAVVDRPSWHRDMETESSSAVCFADVLDPGIPVVPRFTRDWRGLQRATDTLDIYDPRTYVLPHASTEERNTPIAVGSPHRVFYASTEEASLLKRAGNWGSYDTQTTEVPDLGNLKRFPAVYMVERDDGKDRHGPYHRAFAHHKKKMRERSTWIWRYKVIGGVLPTVPSQERCVPIAACGRIFYGSRREVDFLIESHGVKGHPVLTVATGGGHRWRSPVAPHVAVDGYEAKISALEAEIESLKAKRSLAFQEKRGRNA